VDRETRDTHNKPKGDKTVITYEVNIICDKCGNECVTGEPLQAISAALMSAALEASDNGWKDKGEKWLCSVCVMNEEGPQT
jgi:hypothetical protein